MTNALILQTAVPSDAPRIARLCRDEVETGLGWRWRAGAVARLMSRPQCEVAVARLGSELVGFAAMELGPNIAELLLLAVSREHRREGIGTALLDFLEDEARTAGVEAVWLHVRARNNPAISFYEMGGYRIEEHLRNHYAVHEDALRMQHRLAEQITFMSEPPDLAALLRGQG